MKFMKEFRARKVADKEINCLSNRIEAIERKYQQATLWDRQHRTAIEIGVDFENLKRLYLQRRNKRILNDWAKNMLLHKVNLTA